MGGNSGYTLIGVMLCLGLLLSCTASYRPDAQPSNHHSISNLVKTPDAVPRHEAPSRSGNAPKYQVNGSVYYTLKSRNGYFKKGVASWYGKKFHGRLTASGEVYDMYQMTAAHKTLPLPTYAEITHLANGKQIVVKINDRGPFSKERLIDLSYVAALKLGMVKSGTANVSVRAIEVPASVTVNDGVEEESLSYFIQIGAFSNRMNAEQLVRQMKNARLRTKIEMSSQLYRVLTGPYQSQADVNRTTSTLARYGIDDVTIVAQ